MTTQAPSALISAILGRPEHEIDVSEPLAALATKRILITGGDGSIGHGLRRALAAGDCGYATTDAVSMDVRYPSMVDGMVEERRPDVIFHLAGAKHAPEGEEDPVGVAMTNAIGTANVLAAADAVGARVVTASTCKAANPQTAYGASKLIAERATLNAGGSVARFFNVIETCGNVFRTWEGLAEHESIPVTPAARYFITIREAVALVLWAAVLPPGRYIVNPGRRPRTMPSVAAALYPDRPQQFIPLRRGDRMAEPMLAVEERAMPVSAWLWRITSSHDAPVPA